MEFHDLANVFPMLSDDELNALARDIAENGQRHEITLYQGKIIDGRNRYAACMLAGVEPRYTEYTGDNPVAFVVSENIARRHLDESQRAMCAERLANMKHGGDRKNESRDQLISRSDAAKMLNVSVPSLKRAAQVIEHGVPELVQAVERGEIAVSKAATIAREPVEVQREIVKQAPHVSHNSGNNEWYTPSEYIEAARRVMGRIDLDPASSEIANGVVMADKFYSADDDGLSHEWAGRVWMNPPYSSDLIWQFAAKLRKHYQAGDVVEAIALVNNATETAWFYDMAQAASAIAFTHSRVKYLNEALEPKGAPLQGQALIYFGKNVKKFREAFDDLCWSAVL